MAANNAPPPSPPSTTSHVQKRKTVTLVDWWLTKPQTNTQTETLGVAGHTSQQRNQATRCFSSAPILKIFDLFDLETVDGVTVLLRGFINKQRTLQNGFPRKVLDDFVIGFPPNWMEYCSKTESTAQCVTPVKKEDEKDSVEEHGHFHDKPHNSDSHILDIGVQDCKDVMLIDKTSTPLNLPLVEISHEEDIIEAGNDVLCEMSPMRPGFEDDPSIKMSPIVSNTVDSCTQSKLKFSGVPSRRITRSMKAMDSSESLNKKAVNVVDCDIKPKSGKTVSKSSSVDMATKMESKEKQIDQNVGSVIIYKDEADVSGESPIDIEKTNLVEKHITPKCSDSLNNTSVGVTDVKDNTVNERRNTKSRRYKKKNRPQKEGASATQGISSNSKEAMMTQNRSKTKLSSVKRKLIMSPKSTPSRGKKVSVEREGSANILSIESFSGKKSRSGRVVLPPLEFWRNQKVVYDEDREICGVQQPK